MNYDEKENEQYSGNFDDDTAEEEVDEGVDAVDELDGGTSADDDIVDNEDDDVVVDDDDDDTKGMVEAEASADDDGMDDDIDNVRVMVGGVLGGVEHSINGDIPEANIGGVGIC